MKQFASLLAAGLVVAGCQEEPDTAVPARPVVTEIVSPSVGPGQRYIATVTPNLQTNLGFLIVGKVAERKVDIGDLVKQGEVLARLDPEDLAANLRAASAGVAVAQTRLGSARAARDRTRELNVRGVASAQRLEEAERVLKTAQADLDSAEAHLARAVDRLDFATLTAPHDGVITDVTIEAGATVSAGEVVMSLAGTREREVVLDLTGPETAGLPDDAEFIVRLQSVPDIQTRAVLDRIDPVANAATRTRRVHLALRSDDPAFRLGVLTFVSPVADKAAHVTLPVTALFGDAENPAIWVVDRTSDTVHRQAVSLGKTIAGRILIADGVAAGDEVVIKGVHSLEDGQSVGQGMSE